jgi:antitoxin (DNA-binding transcriptional repressor) of toxin-antitoxin stability system
MRAVGIRELKNRLSEYLRAVRAGERVLVTDRGRVVAETRPPVPGGPDLGSMRGISAMVREGRLQPGLPNAEAVYPEQPSRVPDGTAERLLDELRDDR